MDKMALDEVATASNEGRVFFKRRHPSLIVLQNRCSFDVMPGIRPCSSGSSRSSLRVGVGVLCHAPLPNLEKDATISLGEKRNPHNL